MKRIALEGNVGSGKSSVLKWAAKTGLATPVYEPVSRWQNCGGVNMLQLFYADHKRWAFHLQSFIQLTMFESSIIIPRPTTAHEVMLHERTVMSSRVVFTEALKQAGWLTLPEQAMLDESYRFQESIIKPTFDVIIYLKCPAVVCYERVKERGRKEETNVSINYLQLLGKLYDDWLELKQQPTNSKCVVTIDATLPESEIQKQVRTVVEYVREIKH